MPEKGYCNYVHVKDVEHSISAEYDYLHEAWKWDSRYIFDGCHYYQKGRGTRKLLVFPYMDGDVVLYFQEAENDDAFGEKMNKTIKDISRGDHLLLVPIDSKKTMDILLAAAHKVHEQQIYQGTVANI